MFSNHSTRAILSPPHHLSYFSVLDWFLSSLSFFWQYAWRQGGLKFKGFLNIPWDISNIIFDWLKIKKQKSCPHMMLGFCTCISWGEVTVPRIHWCLGKAVAIPNTSWLQSFMYTFHFSDNKTLSLYLHKLGFFSWQEKKQTRVTF